MPCWVKPATEHNKAKAVNKIPKMLHRFSKMFFLLLLAATLILPDFRVLAQDISDNPSGADSLTVCGSTQECQDLLAQLEQEIAGLSTQIGKTQAEKQTLQNKIYILQNQIKKVDLQIKQSNVLIRDVGVQIVDTTASIVKTTSNIEDSRGKLVDILRLINEEDKESLVEILLTSNKLSDFFDNFVALEALLSKNQELLENIKQLKVSLQDQKDSLGKEQDDLGHLLQIQVLQKQQSQNTTKEQQSLLAQTKGKESEYQKLLTQSQEKAAQIRSRIFELAGVAKPPTFEQALDTAKEVALAVNIRPAFLLAVISQESAIGRNVGQCYLVNADTGEGIKVANGATAIRTMKPQRDVPIFLNLAQELGRDPYKTPVSCWIPIYIQGEPFGWGGAMGPAQFIPSTWNLYAGKLKDLLGKVGDPWGIKDSFMASALYLADLGASSKTIAKEKAAANKYSGGYSWYASQVMERADCIQDFIDTNSMSSECQQELGLQ